MVTAVRSDDHEFHSVYAYVLLRAGRCKTKFGIFKAVILKFVMQPPVFSITKRCAMRSIYVDGVESIKFESVHVPVQDVVIRQHLLVGSF